MCSFFQVSLLNGLKRFQNIRKAFFTENVLSTIQRQECEKEISEEEVSTWIETPANFQPKLLSIENSVVTTVNLPHTKPVGEKRNWFISCLKCYSPVVYNHRVHHVRKHIDEENLQTRLFHCLMCPRDKACHSNYLECMRRHVRLTHHVKRPVANLHYIKDEQFDQIIEEMLTKCFTGSNKYADSANSANTVNSAVVIPTKLCFVRCQKCRQMVTSSKQKDHVKQHIAEQGDLNRLMMCLFCTEGDNFKTLRYPAMKNHLLDTHQINEPCADKNYTLGRLATTAMDFKKLFNQCFGVVNSAAVTVKRVRRRKVKSKKKIKQGLVKCHQCRKLTKNNYECMKSHSLQHLRQKRVVKYLFDCLECRKEENRISTFLLAASVRSHLKTQHNIKSPQKGEHFTDERNKFREIIIAEMNKNFRTGSLKKKFNYGSCLQCQQCDKWIRNNPECFKSHSVYHLKENGILDYIYQCLECRKGDQSTTFMQNANVRRHLKVYHKIKYPLNGEHFTDDTNKYRDLIIAEAKKNFN